MPDQVLDFEQPIFDLKEHIVEFESASDDSAGSTEKLREMKRQLTELTKTIYGNLTPWQTVKVARHSDRPYTVDYLSLVFEEFVELHGDKFFGDDRAVRAGFAKLDGIKVMVIGHQKGRNLKERQESYFGCAHPEGYRKAMLKMRMAEKYGLPVICFIDTPGAYPGIGAEERGQAHVIAESMFEMSRLKTPIVCVVIGEGGSGGALGIGVGNKVAMLEHSYYSVISPEGCAGILWKSGQHAEKAADALKFTASYLKNFGVIDDVIEEPLGGAHCDHHSTAARMKSYLVKTLKSLADLSEEELVRDRYERFRKIGVFTEEATLNPGNLD